ncbi:MAG: glutamine--fructose-6-phosphate aminotransferase, partial [Candidatus Margulisbacteria bacterium]|nr:glutamine--fructose-6-phosphate aminotransferase [Candidatus Margulisiibacteriota bacterium]
MCGIFGYIGNKEAGPILIEGLKKLEYRGYDSAGMVVLNSKNIHIKKCTGKVADLEKIYLENPIKGVIGLGHTRWATHGGVTDKNSHPHTDESGEVAVIHNGIIENFDVLRKSLEAEGHHFKSETDTEVLAHLIGAQLKNTDDIYEAVRMALKEVKGAYAIGVIYKKAPGKIIVAKKSSPLVVGIGDNEVFIASDAPAFIQYTNKVFFMKDFEMGVLTKDSAKFTNLEREELKKDLVALSLKAEQIDKG